VKVARKMPLGVGGLRDFRAYQVASQPFSLMMDDLDTRKIVFCGQGRVGKTSLITRFCCDEFSNNQRSTVSTGYVSKLYVGGRHECMLRITDTAGQEDVKNVTKSYFRGNDVIVLCFCPCEASWREDLRGWHEIVVEEVGPEAVPIILVATQADRWREAELADIADEEALMREFGVARFFRTSAKSRENVREVFQFAVEECRSVYRQGVDLRSRAPQSPGARPCCQ